LCRYGHYQVKTALAGNAGPEPQADPYKLGGASPLDSNGVNLAPGVRMTMSNDLRKRLPAAWRGPFEASFGCSLAHVAMVCGPETDRDLAAAGAAAQAVDANTIRLSSRLLAQPEPKRLLVIGHELAHTIQLARGGTEATNLLEAEAWQAARAALDGERRPVRLGGRGPLAVAADAIVGDLLAKTYYTKFPQMTNLLDARIDLQIDKNNVQLLSPLSFRDLLSRMLKSDKTSFLLDFHGTERGLVMPLYPGARHKEDGQWDKLQPDGTILDDLMTYRRVRELKKTAGSDLARWKEIVKLIWHDLGEEDRSVPIDLVDLARAMALVDHWLKFIQLPDKLNSPLKQIDDLVDLQIQIERKHIDLLELRACNMGRSPDTMESYRRFFNANSLGVPDVHSGIVQWGGMALGAPAMDKFLRDHPEARAYYVYRTRGIPGRIAALEFTREPPPKIQADVNGAFASKSAIQFFLDAFQMPGAKYTGGALYLHFLFDINPPPFPLEQWYWYHIKYAKKK
jgi:hypothetical protein